MQILFDGWDELSRDMIWILPLFFFLTFSYFLRLRHTNPRNLKWKPQSVQFDSESIEILTKKQNLRHCVWCIHTIEKVSVDVFFVCSKIHEQSTRTTSLLNDKITILNHRIPIENNTVNDRRLMRKKNSSKCAISMHFASWISHKSTITDIFMQLKCAMLCSVHFECGKIYRKYPKFLYFRTASDSVNCSKVWKQPRSSKLSKSIEHL